ncbi:MAG: IPTL-CTERM sorting domain-containing protein [Betaproteobacteria bacterium]
MAVVLAFAVTLANAANVAVFSDEESTPVSISLTSAGNTVTVVTEPQIAAGLGAYNVLYMGHNSSGLTPASCAAIASFVNAGGGVVTEWNGVYNLFTSDGANLYLGVGTKCALFAGTVGEGNAVGTNTPVTITNPGSPVFAGLTSPLQLGNGSEYFYLVTGYDPAVWSVIATYNGWALTGNPAIMTASLGAGKVVVGVFDFGDVLGTDANADLLLANMVGFAAGAVAPPPPPPPVVAVSVPTMSPGSLAMLALMLGALGVAVRRRMRSRG